MPVINVTMSNYDLYDYGHGIYATGPGAQVEFPHLGANYWHKWWRKAHIEMFDSVAGGFSVGCEIAISGGFSRALDKKSFKIRFRDEHGPARLNYDLFGNGQTHEYRNFVLRGGSQDIMGVMIRDEFFTSLMQPQCPDLLIQKFRPVALYINKEYFGLYYIREKVDEHFVADHYDVKDDSVSIVTGGRFAEEGTMKYYNEFMSYVRNHDLSQKENYEYVKANLDLVGLIDFKLGQIYSSNNDPDNVRFTQARDSKGDRKWHLVFYDLDDTWQFMMPAGFYLRGGWQTNVANVGIHNFLIDRLLRNSEFRELFMQRLSLHLHSTFSAKNATQHFDKLIALIKPEMPRNCERWAKVLTYEKWLEHVADFRAKFNERPAVILNDLRKELKITPEEEKKYFADLGY